MQELPLAFQVKQRVQIVKAADRAAFWPLDDESDTRVKRRRSNCIDLNPSSMVLEQQLLRGTAIETQASRAAVAAVGQAEMREGRDQGEIKRGQGEMWKGRAPLQGWGGAA